MSDKKQGKSLTPLPCWTVIVTVIILIVASPSLLSRSSSPLYQVPRHHCTATLKGGKEGWLEKVLKDFSILTRKKAGHAKTRHLVSLSEEAHIWIFASDTVFVNSTSKKHMYQQILRRQCSLGMPRASIHVDGGGKKGDWSAELC